MQRLLPGIDTIKFLALLLPMWVIFVGYSAAEERERIAYAFALVEKLEISKMIVDLVELSLQPHFERYEIPQKEGLIDDNLLRKYFLEEVKSSEEELKWNLAEIYSKYFTEDELKAILRFFDSPVGRIWRDNESMIQPEIDQVGHEWGQILTQRILKKFETTYGEKF